MKALLLTYCLFLITVSCEKKNKEICQWSHFTFEHPVSVYPIKESYNIGDTIWFEMNFPDVFNATVKNNYNGYYRTETLQLKNFDFHRNFLSIFKLSDSTLSVTGQTKGKWAESFTGIYEVYDMIQELPDGPEYKLLCENNYYKLKIGVKLRVSGIFLYNPIFMHYYPESQGKLNEVEIRPECRREHIEDIRFPVNKQPNGTHITNYHLFEQYMNPALENDIERIKKECFTFVVN
jgi:hypothetical protein